MVRRGMDPKSSRVGFELCLVYPMVGLRPDLGSSTIKSSCSKGQAMTDLRCKGSSQDWVPNIPNNFR
ncbi:hypothetical protein D5086_023430 [Populus alba]|uniref:Uncharacterized protein n=1 Tax=Populus alba TaxID=43335 RepID=A0ACC4BA76_POPAL